MMQFYVYEILDLDLEMFYIGSRTCECNPSDDLGVNYFSSSTNKNFMEKQKKFPELFVYNILKEFNTYKEALDYEMLMIRNREARKDDNCYNGRVPNILSSIRSRITKDATEALGKLICLARKEHGITQASMAERVEITRATYMRIENGCEKVSIGSYFECCFILGIDLFGGDKENVTNLSRMLSYMNRLIPMNISNKIVDDNF